MSISDYEWIFQMGDNGILLLDEAYRVKNANRMATELTGYPYDDLIGIDFSALLGVKGRDFLFELCEGSPALESRRFCIEMEIVVSSGRPRPFEVCVSTAATPDKKKNIAIFIRDLTERILMEREIRRSNEFMTSLIESSYDGIIAADMTGTIIIFNKGAENLLGYTADEVIGKMNASALYPPGVARDIMRKLRDDKYGGKGRLSAQRYVGIARSGEQIPVMLSGSLIYQDDRETATVGFFYDLRDILSAQQEILESEKNFHYLFETVRHGVYFSTREGRFIDCNQTLLDMLGYASKEDFLSIDIPTQLYADPGERLKFQQIIERDGFVKDYEVTFKRKSGRPIDVQLTAHLKKDRSGIWYQGLVIDVTERRIREQQMLQSAKMASLGKLAAGVAHEINNPLGGIFVYANLLEEKTQKDDPLHAYIEKILTAASRTKEIVKGLLEFSRPTKLNFVSTSVNDALENVLALLDQQGLFYHVQITKDLIASPPGVIADPTQIEQVFMNIIMNATEAMQGDGRLDIKTAVSADGKLLDTIISDTGPGISQEDIGRIFEPFYTTKDPSSTGSGTGLGLAISYGIIEKHNGTITVASREGSGTTFTVRLPIEDEKQ
ncbi:MAG: PAS domain S-box protein [Deltaproteobacteria bacterium]|nr:PAS domain S-box protein [Candidatus Zymogenaceae bacterium]